MQKSDFFLGLATLGIYLQFIKIQNASITMLGLGLYMTFNYIPLWLLYQYIVQF